MVSLSQALNSQMRGSKKGEIVLGAWRRWQKEKGVAGERPSKQKDNQIEDSEARALRLCV